MSAHLRTGRARARSRSRRSSRHLALRLLPIVALCITAIAFAGHCLVLMQSVARDDHASPFGFWPAAAAFIACVLLVVILEVARIGKRFEQPERLLRRAMQRMRGGDVGFRVTAKRGEPLGGLVRECNELLEWLNANPPAGARVGGDIVELPVDDAEVDA